MGYFDERKLELEAERAAQKALHTSLVPLSAPDDILHLEALGLVHPFIASTKPLPGNQEVYYWTGNPNTYGERPILVDRVEGGKMHKTRYWSYGILPASVIVDELTADEILDIAYNIGSNALDGKNRAFAYIVDSLLEMVPPSTLLQPSHPSGVE